MATLGELLFYIATQQQDSAAGAGGSSANAVAEAWGITSSTISLVARCVQKECVIYGKVCSKGMCYLSEKSEKNIIEHIF